MADCKQCGTQFEIHNEDLKFYEKVSPVFNGKKYQIPPPTYCPECRWQRRLTFRNERTLYKRKCNLTGNDIISMYPADSPFPVYHISDWIGEKWNPMDYGCEFDFNRPFFEQFEELCNLIPHFSAFVDPQMDVNSEYTNCSSEARNCYLISQAEYNEDCYYSRGISNSKNCSDCLRVIQCELCYECTYASNCYNCYFNKDIYNCSDCYFSTDLRGCKNCFGCHGLSQKEYCIFNKKVSKEEWKEKVESLVLTHQVIEQMKKNSDETRLKTPQRAVHTVQCESCTGDHIIECRESDTIFDSKNLEHCKYCYEIANGAKDCMDYCMWGINVELLYECNGCGEGVFHLLFCNHCWQGVSELIYCESCFPSVSNCFGCYGLRHAKYCILNKQYTQEEYEELVPRIIEHMKSTGEWGEFFPARISPHGYNETLAQSFFPLEKQEVESRGWKWYEEEQTDLPTPTNYKIPESIAEVDDSICDEVLECETTSMPYKIIPQELRLYNKMGIPIPKKCPAERHKERMQNRNPRKLWGRQCNKCNKSIQTTYAPDRPEKVLCEECYLKEVY